MEKCSRSKNSARRMFPTQKGFKAGQPTFLHSHFRLVDEEKLSSRQAAFRIFDCAECAFTVDSVCHGDLTCVFVVCKPHIK
ncbi:hypothetical protein BDI4_580060 [Burkholderia diffusa]|nr:hypothetical protein BDI4_580060 [Burkholderia diffusa]